MNRRMVKAKAARKFHAARQRWWERNPPTIRITIHFDAAALRLALFGMSQAAHEAAAAMRGFGDAVARSNAIDGQCMRLEPGQLFARLPGGGLQHLGKTGPLLLERPRPAPLCGKCGEAIRPDPMTGTTCACVTRERAFLAAVPDEPPRPRTWSPLLCECTGTGPTCGYCRGHGVP